LVSKAQMGKLYNSCDFRYSAEFLKFQDEETTAEIAQHNY
jgi:hypothetical protein